MSHRIVGLRAENFKRLVAVDIAPEGDVVVLAGANAQGKSSVIDAIWAALGGKAGAVDQPVRHGESTAVVELDLGDLKVTKKWKAGGTATLTVESAGGARFPSPQAVLDSLIAKFSFDPLDFIKARPAEQADVLAKVVGIDLVALAQERKAIYDARTDANREVKRLTAVLESSPRVPATTPDVEVDVAAAATELRELQADMDRYRGLLEEHARLTARLAEITAEGQAVRARLPEAPDARRDELVALVDNSTEINRAVAAKRQRAQADSDLKQWQAASAGYSEQLEAHDAAKQKAIATAALPVAGLGLDDSGITLGGVPFSQASSAEKIRTAVAIGMSLAKADGIRVITIRDGSLLDSANMAIIQQMAAENDFQVWLEVVDSTGSVGIQIEDGQVVPNVEVSSQ